MNDKVVPIKPPEPHMTGMVKCLSCRHEWCAVRPVGTVWHECPSCKLELGRAMGSVSESGDHWHCKCGNDLFYIKPTHSYCPCCGTVVSG